MTDISTIETAARIYADEVKKLAAAIDHMESEIAEIKDRYDGTIAALINSAEASYHDIYNYIAESPEQFEKPQPRTLTFDNTIKVGFQKARDKYTYDDDDSLAARILENLPIQHKNLVKTKITIAKEALKGLTPGELRLIGVTHTPGGDEPVIKLLLTDVEKFIQRYLKAKE
jgi:hypothetical protein